MFHVSTVPSEGCESTKLETSSEGTKLCLHQNVAHSHPSLGSRPGHVAQVGGRALRNPQVEKPKSVAKSGRNPKIVAPDRKLVSDIFASHRRSIRGETVIRVRRELHTPKHPLDTGYTTPTLLPYPIKSAQVELRSERV
jgi:hypothetical protein